MFPRRISCNPGEVHFPNMSINTPHSQSVLLTNTTSQDLELSLKPCPTLDRDYEVHPSEFRLYKQETKSVKISVRASKPGSYRDVVHIITPSFSEKLYINLAPGEPGATHYDDIVKDKDEQLQSSQSRIDRLEEEIEDLNEKLRLANLDIVEKTGVEQELARVQQENLELRNIIDEMRRGEVYHQKFKELMNEKVPSLENLIELTLRQEQEKNERKNQKILEILQIKDSLIEDLEDRSEELNNALTLMQHKLNDSKVLLSNTEKSLQNTQKLVEDLKTANFEKDQAIAGLRGRAPGQLSPQEDSSVLKTELLKNFEHIKILSETVQHLEQENAKLREREEYVLELSSRQSKHREDQDRAAQQKDSTISELRSQVQRQSDHIETLVSKLSELNYSNLLSKLSNLEEENKVLSKRLAESQNSSITFKQEDLDDNGRLNELETENERLMSSVKEYSERSQRLEEQVSEKNREIIAMQNEIIDHKRYRSEMILKAAPSPQEDLAKLASSLRQEQARLQVLQEENDLLKKKVFKMEANNEQLSFEISSLYENIENGQFDQESQNKLISKINSKLKNLKAKEEEALKAAALAEEGLKVLQFELAQSSTSDVVRELRKTQGELIQAKSKNDFLTAGNLKLKEELEDKNKILMSMQFLVTKEEKTSNKKLRKRARAPPKLVKALLAAKLAEFEAIKKLKLAGKFEKDLKHQLDLKEEQIKSMRKDLISDRSSESNCNSELDLNIQRKLVALEHELNELREQEMLSWQSYKPLALAGGETSKANDDTEVLIEGLLYLVERIAGQDQSSELESEASDKPRGKNQENIERSQRVLIRALSKVIVNDDEKLAKVAAFAPSREEDRKIWYLELIEQQFALFNQYVKKLQEVTQRIGSDSSQSVTNSANFKGLYLELSKSSKLLLDEINLIMISLKLVKNDCESLNPRSKSRQVDVKELLQEEIEKATNEKSFEIRRIGEENQRLNADLEMISGKFEKNINEMRRFEQLIMQQKAKQGKVEAEKEELQTAIESLCKELKEETALKEQALMRVDKAHNELKDWQKAQIDVLTDRERLIIDLQSQIKVLRDQNLGVIQENLDLHKTNYDDSNKELLNHELLSLEQENDSLQKRIYELSSNFIDEKQKLISQIAELEEQLGYIQQESRFFEGSPGKMTLKKDPSIQLASLQVLLKEKITALDDETRKRIEAEGKLRNILMTESAAEQKMTRMEEELYSEISKLQDEVKKYEKNAKDANNEKDLIMVKFSQITESLKSTTESLKKAEQEIFILQEEKKSQVNKLNNKLKSNDSSTLELKSKLKELNKVLETYNKENEALHIHLSSLEKEFEVTSLKLEDSEKINSNLKHKLKEYEQKIDDLEEIRVMETNGNSSRYEQVRLELKQTYDEFEKVSEQYESQLSCLKDQLFTELKKKSVKRPLEVTDLLLQIAKKDSLIKALRNDLKSSKPKKTEKNEKKVKKFDNASAEEEIIYLQNQNYKLKAQIKGLESQVQSARDELDRAASEPRAPELNPKKDIQEIERRHRLDLQKLAEEVARLREKWHSPEEWSSVQALNRELETNVRKLNDELLRKKEIVENLKAIKDQQDSENCQIQEELEQAKDSTEKMKKLRNELSRKEKIVYDLKSALEASKESEKKLLDDNYQMADKIKSLKNEVSRKENLAKELKSRLESLSQESVKLVSDDVEGLKDKIKKLKADCERKDSQIKTFKSKLETAELELETLNAEKQNLSTDAFASLEKELRKNERLLAQLRKTEAQFQSLCSITRKIFKQLTDSVEGLKRGAADFDHEYYTDCMDILNMDMKDLSEFVGQRSVGTTLCKIERLIEQGEDTGEVLQIFNSLLEERLDLERSVGQKGKVVAKLRSGRIKAN